MRTAQKEEKRSTRVEEFGASLVGCDCRYSSSDGSSFLRALAAFLICRALPLASCGREIAPAEDCGQLRSAAQDPISQSSSPRQLLIGGGQASWQNRSNNCSFVFPRRRAFPFLSQENFFSPMKNKIHFFLVDFKTNF
jgi:hypothetical protein